MTCRELMMLIMDNVAKPSGVSLTYSFLQLEVYYHASQIATIRSHDNINVTYVADNIYLGNSDHKIIQLFDPEFFDKITTLITETISIYDKKCSKTF